MMKFAKQMLPVMAGVAATGFLLSTFRDNDFVRKIIDGFDA